MCFDRLNAFYFYVKKTVFFLFMAFLRENVSLLHIPF